jgi:Sulfotransferase family
MTEINVESFWESTSLSEERTSEFRRNEGLEKLLAELSEDLREAEYALANRYVRAGMPHALILVMGPLRSGTTLFTQWLANTGVVSYPTNLLARFYAAPIIGAKIQLLLTDSRYNFRNELSEFARQSDYRSENGKTRGVLAPNEFWYFWRRFLSERERDVWSDDELRRTMDIRSMLAELRGIMNVFEKPFAAKGMLFNYNIPFMDSILEDAIFVQLTRDAVANVSSVLEARKRQHGNSAAWYSFKIPEYGQLKDLDPIMQAAGQVHYINRAVCEGMSGLSEGRSIRVNYEEFCRSPRRTFEELCRKLRLDRSEYRGPESFEISRTAVEGVDADIRRAIDHFSRESR